MIIGITGSSGAGKSTVCEILKNKYGVEVINADEIAKRLSKKGTNYLADIVEQFGKEILLEDGELDRPKLAEIIYNSPEKREKLNRCTFKYICKEIELEIGRLEAINKHESANGNSTNDADLIIAIDAPLLFEAELDKLCQYTVAVISDNRELQIQRVIQRDGITKEQAIARLNAQKSNEFYATKSDFIIFNKGELKEVENQILQLLYIYITFL